MLDTTPTWIRRRGRVHGRLAIQWWPTTTTPNYSVASEPVLFQLPHGSATINRVGTMEATRINIHVRDLAGKSRWKYQVGWDDWQGIVDGYFEPNGTDQTKVVWFGESPVHQRHLNDEDFDRLCSTLRDAFNLLRWEKRRLQHLLPIGANWGWIPFTTYLATTWQILLRKPCHPPLLAALRNREDFGYQIVQSPRTAWAQLRTTL